MNFPPEKFPDKVDSWIKESDRTYIKEMDRSAFLHHGTGIPKDKIRDFFGVQDIEYDKPRDILLIYDDNPFSTKLKLTKGKRTQLHWHVDLEKQIQTIFPDLFSLFSHGVETISNPPHMKFTKTDILDKYVISFYSNAYENLNVPINQGEIIPYESLQKIFSVGVPRGMLRSTKTNSLVLVSYSYGKIFRDRWEGDTFYYTGEGQVGDQSIAEEYNKTLTESDTNRVNLFLFRVFHPNQYLFIGEVELLNKPLTETQPDKNKEPRSVYLFPLKLKNSQFSPADIQNILEKNARNLQPQDPIEKRRKNLPKNASDGNNIPILLDRLAFFEQFELFKEKIRQNSDDQSDFYSFTVGLAGKWENYKRLIFDEAQKRLELHTWNLSDIGTGKILKKVIGSIEINCPNPLAEGGKLINNLLVWDNRYGNERNAHRSLEESLKNQTKKIEYETLLYNFFKGIVEPSEAFRSFINLAGKKYNFIAYLFFIKDQNRYLPISTSNFDDAFKMLKIPLKTTQNCSWENYQAFIAAIQQIRSALKDEGIDDVRLIDAHSFCWMLVKLPIEKPTIQPFNIPIPEQLSIDSTQPNKSKLPLKDGQKDPANKPDFDKRNRDKNALGKLAEAIVKHAEIKRLTDAGRADLAEQIDPERADYPQFGYDILSFDTDESEKYIEVKAVSKDSDYYSFYLSDYEWDKSQNLPNYFFYFVENTRSKSPKIKFISGKDLLQKYLQPNNYRVSLPYSKI